MGLATRIVWEISGEIDQWMQLEYWDWVWKVNETWVWIESQERPNDKEFRRELGWWHGRKWPINGDEQKE